MIDVYNCPSPVVNTVNKRLVPLKIMEVWFTLLRLENEFTYSDVFDLMEKLELEPNRRINYVLKIFCELGYFTRKHIKYKSGRFLYTPTEKFLEIQKKYLEG